MLRRAIIVFTAVSIVLVSSTKVNDCVSGRIIPDENQVQITNCDAPICKLKKNTRVGITQEFTPDHDIQKLTTSVHANILGIPFPFIGVDGADASRNVFNSDGTNVSWPLKKGVKYIYKNEFPILRIYPQLILTVHWALKENKKDVTCFEIKSQIIA